MLNKWGQQDDIKCCIRETVISAQYYSQNIIQPTLIMIDIVLNISSFNVFLQNNLKSNTISFMFRVLALFDTFAPFLGPGQDI